MMSNSRRLPQFWTLVLAAALCLSAQSNRAEDLAVGKLLVTPRGAPDPLFAQSVILLVRYNESGALGLMVNRRSTVPISRALRELNGAAAHSDPVFIGGPVELNTVFALTRTPRKPEGATPVFGNIYFIAGKTALEKALTGSFDSSALRIYVGYCGWGPHQLENEVNHRAWYIFNRSEDLTFDAEPESLWSKLIGEAEGLKAWLGFATPMR